MHAARKWSCQWLRLIVSHSPRWSLMFARVVLCQALQTSKQHTVTYNCLSSAKEMHLLKSCLLLCCFTGYIQYICNMYKHGQHHTHYPIFFIRDKHFGLSFYSHFVCALRETSSPTFFCPKHSLCIQHSRDLHATPQPVPQSGT